MKDKRAEKNTIVKFIKSNSTLNGLINTTNFYCFIKFCSTNSNDSELEVGTWYKNSYKIRLYHDFKKLEWQIFGSQSDQEHLKFLPEFCDLKHRIIL